MYILHKSEYQSLLSLAAVAVNIHVSGPTGCGKSTLVRQFLDHLEPGREHLVVACTADMTVDDLLGRWVIEGGDTVFLDGPLLRAAEEGRPIHLDEIQHLSAPVLQVLFSLTDDNRQTWCAGRKEIVCAQASFRVILSGLDPWRAPDALRHRFISIHVPYAEPMDIERMLRAHYGVPREISNQLQQLAFAAERWAEEGHKIEMTARLLIHASRLCMSGVPFRLAVKVAIAAPLLPDHQQCEAFMDELSTRGILRFEFAPSPVVADGSEPSATVTAVSEPFPE